jgi:hypothetical protein
MADGKIPKRTKAPSLLTYKKIQELAAYREKYLTAKGEIPSLTSSCQKMTISYRTVKRHAPQLIERWKGTLHGDKEA